ncbi:MAG: type I restriction enzyme HsdR N-terminal domain-containing protein, partial [Treponema sp.]|nr:type I restriction enzyme HsdR N-terminal domain-containing protein [Treponema sp.]
MERTATGIKQALFGSLDFSSILSNKDFKEADVRALIIDPMLKGLGFSHENILREKALQSPFLRTGSKKRKVTLIPDYALKVENGFAWVLDAKAPHQKIVEDGNVEQAYSYAAHPEIRSNYFALCNGLEFACFRTTDTEKPALYFRVEEIEKHWQSLCRLLSPESFQEGNKFVYDKIAYQEREKTPAVFDYAGKPLLPEIPVKRGAAKRHFGVHGYFTRQAWNVVAGYIKHFSSEGDTVLDPFGGSGVTAIEALVNGRKAVNVDINPLAIFMVRTLLEPVDFGKLSEGYNKVRDTYLKLEPKTKKEVHEILNKYPGPKNLPLPKGSDVATVPELFSGEQTAKLALLKALIHKEKDKNVRAALMLMFSGMVTKFNLTFHASGARTEGRGAASALMYYRYRLAREPVSLDIIESFDMRFKRVAAAKREIEQQCLLNRKTAVEMFADAQIIKGSATDLSFLKT